MSKKIKVSLIVPVYNVEKYIERCIISLINQTLNEIEIIIVNDASPDKSGAIIKRYAKKDRRIVYIEHKSNKGHGGAINTALTIAKGEYIWQIDSDDFIDTNAAAFMYDYAGHHALDALAVSANNFFEMDGKLVFAENENYCYPQHMCGQIYRGDEFVRECYMRGAFFHTPPWGYLFARSLISDYHFRENVSYEDTDSTPVILSKASRVGVLKYTPVFRLIHASNSVAFLKDAKAAVSEKTMLQRLAVVESLLAQISTGGYAPRSPLVFYTLCFYFWNIQNEIARYKEQSGVSIEQVDQLKKKIDAEIFTAYRIRSFSAYTGKYAIKYYRKEPALKLFAITLLDRFDLLQKALRVKRLLFRSKAGK